MGPKSAEWLVIDDAKETSLEKLNKWLFRASEKFAPIESLQFLFVLCCGQ